MPGDPNNPGFNRPIKSELKSKKIVFEEERPIRWSFMKYLREHSNLKEFYPNISPYHEAYKVRDNTWAIYTDTFDGAGDPWMYLINGPKKALLIDTGFGIGNLKGLVKKLINDDDKEIIVANTHYHFDHAYGNSQFDDIYIHEDGLYETKSIMNEHIWDYLYDHQTRKGIYTEFDVDDIVGYKEYNLHLLKDNECLDLGGNYLVEAIPLRGHAVGQCGYLDRVSHCLFTGDTGSISNRFVKDEVKQENATVERLRDDYRKIVNRIEEVGGVFPGHGAFDLTPVVLKYSLDALEKIVKDPKCYDEVKEFIDKQGNIKRQYIKYVYQGTSIKYSDENIFK